MLKTHHIKREREKPDLVLISIKIKQKWFKADLQICQIAEPDKADGVLFSCWISRNIRY